MNVLVLQAENGQYTIIKEEKKSWLEKKSLLLVILKRVCRAEKKKLSIVYRYIHKCRI